MISMRTRTLTSTALAALALALAVGCQSTADKERDSEKQRSEANRARTEASQRGMNDQQRVEQKAGREENKADQEHREAMNQMEKDRADYRAKIEKDMADIDKHVDEMKASAMSTTDPTAKADYDAALRDVATRRGELQAALQKIDQATPMNWNDVKSATDKDLDAYRSSVRTASSRIKAAPGRQRNPTMGPARGDGG